MHMRALHIEKGAPQTQLVNVTINLANETHHFNRNLLRRLHNLILQNITPKGLCEKVDEGERGRATSTRMRQDLFFQFSCASTIVYTLVGWKSLVTYFRPDRNVHQSGADTKIRRNMDKCARKADKLCSSKYHFLLFGMTTLEITYCLDILNGNGDNEVNLKGNRCKQVILSKDAFKHKGT